jgi:ABC-type uncharacterized transport system fused permease/ATPase subunit
MDTETQSILDYIKVNNDIKDELIPIGKTRHEKSRKIIYKISFKMGVLNEKRCKNNMFSEDQQYAFDQFRSGKNIFITGPGGTGKTHLIKSMVEYMSSCNTKFQVCALTGCAAVLLGNGTRTLHSWAGMGLANGDDSVIINKIMRNKNCVCG